MATLTFYTGTLNINAAAGSGLAFFADSGFGASVSVGAFPGRTFISDGNGSVDMGEGNNVKYLNSQSGIVGQQGTGIHLKSVPNYLSTLQVHFNHSSAIQVQNAQLRIYDRVSINSPPSGLTCYTAEIIHPTIAQSNNGSGDTLWTNTYGSGSILSLAPSPGVSGYYAGNGSNSAWTDTDHDWYVVISPTPNTIGSKTQFGAYVSLEYL